VFFYSGIDKLCHWRASVEEVADLGLHPSPAFAMLTIFAHLLGGLMLATGFAVWFGAILLAGFTVTATLLTHASGRFPASLVGGS
jgi:uncharacterized membrane protein YphA (DoxX/SURF4 family)